MTKKKAIRVGHRGAARRLISKIEEELEKETTQRDEIESLCETLKKKRDILSELDNEILEEIAEENMEAEIEDSDRTFGAILTPIIYNKLPSDVRKNITRDRGNDDWDIESLRTAIKREVCVQVAGQSTGTSNEDLEILPTASFIAETFPGKNRKQSRKKCLFCEESHHPNTCKNVKDVEKRIEIVKRKRAVVCDLEKFWNLESLGVSGSDNIKSQSEVVKEYGEKSIILENGKYTAKLPWKPDFLPLPHNMELVKQRTGNVIRRLGNKPDLLKMYGDIIMEQERRHFIEKVEETKLPTDRPVHYIPHHPVAKESSTTPIRIVYDCSCKDGRDNPSLNECLESHPPVMNDITGILMRFRAKKYATTSDLEKAFLQIQLDEKDRDATRFFWLSDPTNTSSVLITIASSSYSSELHVRHSF
ncbi:Hypothetical predicted protein [Mytilus galloprovincialis]|uniref:Reverse transcriptase domain-containing protein n=1 Tax=Mytilus galloprovincialis TaxID=29158 RepID=A0A8B6BQX6_MYTGA|nr:Hypothetical predicted protein [Mytilus galloprovincialis]